jgi:quinol monooxygenase YgiN
MIIVTGSVTAAPGKRARLMEISLEHVRRSRTETGCISHSVSVDAENPDRLVFFERWIDLAALQRHFAVPASRAFAREAGGLAERPPDLNAYDAEELKALGG